MPLRGKSVVGVLYVTCPEDKAHGHVEITLSHEAECLRLIGHREGEIVAQTEWEQPVIHRVPLLVLVRAALPGLAGPALRGVSFATTLGASTLIA
jgi:hypothetical protein